MYHYGAFLSFTHYNGALDGKNNAYPHYCQINV